MNNSNGCFSCTVMRIKGQNSYTQKAMVFFCVVVKSKHENVFIYEFKTLIYYWLHTVNRGYSGLPLQGNQ